MRSLGRRLWRSESGAVAPTIALSLVGLMAAGGLAFDYSRMASLDTELQDAADQAALAAATQLDGQPNACARAAAAASALLANDTRFANDVSSRSITVANEGTCDATGSIKFYQSYNQTTDTPGSGATGDANAKVVVVAVNTRTERYALTPVIGALSSGPMTAEAVATLGSGGICKVPPLMMCNPNEGAGGSFPTTADIGRGLKLEAGGGGAWTPGNYGYLDFGNGANSLEAGMGSNNDIEPCVSTDNVQTKPGNTASVPASINTRFDMYENGLVNFCAQGNGNCSPALNTFKDVEHQQFSSGTTPNETASGGDNCGFATGSDPWELPSVMYQPDPTTRLQPAALGNPKSMGLPRDICHAVSGAGDCAAGRFGNGNWDRLLYFTVNHAGATDLAAAAAWAGKSPTATTGPTALTRYDVYRWELATNNLPRRLAETKQRKNPQGNPVGQPIDVYSYATPRCAPGVGASATQKDRRLLTAAVVNCTAGGVQGSSPITPIGWVDLFLVEPSIDRGTYTGKDQIYVEVAGIATRPNGQSAFQFFLRQRPRLLK